MGHFPKKESFRSNKQARAKLCFKNKLFIKIFCNFKFEKSGSSSKQI